MFNKSIVSQRGDFLLESLVGVVLMAILATGVAHINSRVTASLGESRVIENAKTQMRKLLVEGTLCDGSKSVKLPSGDISVSVEGCTAGSVDIIEIEEDPQNAGEFIPVAGVTAVPVSVTPPKALEISIHSQDIEMGGEVTPTPTPTPTPAPGEGGQNIPQT